MTDRLGSLAREHVTVLETLGRFAPAVRDVTDRALAAMKPVLQLVADRLRERRRHAVERQHEQDGAARPSRGPGLGM
jgi:hypothetical protein